MNRLAFIVIIGIFSILVSIATWILDLTGLVEQCIYCRTQRTVIGILGFLMLLPLMKYFFNYLIAYLSYGLGIFGVNVSSAQIFLNIKNDHIGSMMFNLAIGAMFWIIFQVIILHWCQIHCNKSKSIETIFKDRR
jgi:hypothetical protein